MRIVAVFPAVGVVAGGLAGLALDGPPVTAWVLAPLPCAAALAWRLGRPRLTLAAVALSCAAVAMLQTQHQRETLLRPPLRALLDAEFGGFDLSSIGPGARHDPLPVRAVLTDDAVPGPDGVSLRLRVVEVLVRGQWQAADGGVVASIAAPAGLEGAASWRAGRTIEAPMTFRRPARYLNEGVPDFERRLALGGTTLFASIKSGLLVDVRAPGDVVSELAARVRGRTRRAIARWVPARGGAPRTSAVRAPAVREPPETLVRAAASTAAGEAPARDATAAAIAAAVLIGDRAGIPDDVRERLQAAGTYHVIAISGGNIAMFVVLVVGALRLAGVSGRPSAVAALLVLALYGQVASAGPSVWRATVMASLHLAARALDHQAPSWQVTAVAVAGMLVAHPLDLIDPGFQLTMGATVALLHGAGWAWQSPRPRAMQAEARASRTSWSRVRPLAGTAVRWLAAGLFATLAVEVALLPVAALTFSRVTAAGLPLNLVAVPLMAVTQVAGMATVAADTLGLPASVPGWFARAAAQALVDTSRLVDLAPWLVVRMPAPPLALVAAYYLACLGVVATWSRVCGAAAAPVGERRGPTGAGTPSWAIRPPSAFARAAVLGGSTIVVLTAGVAIVAGISWPGREPLPGLRVTMLDVGQGEAILIETSAGAVLVDAGGAPFGSSGFDIGGRVVAPALWARGIRRLAALVVTHGDPDHLGGALSVLRDFAPREVWVGIDVPGHAPSETLAREASTRGARIVRRRAGESFTLGAVRVRVLHPAEPDWERRRVRNDDSVTLEVALGGVALLLTGDIGAAVEGDLVARLTPAPTRVLKAAHHGSRTSSSAVLVDGWRPQTVLISCGRGNSFGHPAPDVLARFAGLGARVLRTDRDGQVTVETDGVRVWTRTYSGG